MDKEKLRRMREIAKYYGAELLENSPSIIVNDKGEERFVTEEDIIWLTNFQETLHEDKVDLISVSELKTEVLIKRDYWEIDLRNNTFEITMEDKVV